jgi:hypothetical protein
MAAKSAACSPLQSRLMMPGSVPIFSHNFLDFCDLFGRLCKRHAQWYMGQADIGGILPWPKLAVNSDTLDTLDILFPVLDTYFFSLNSDPEEFMCSIRTFRHIFALHSFAA